MPYFRHTVTVLRRVIGAEDSYGVPTATETAITTTQRALVQERTGREVASPEGAGVVVSDALIFLPLDADVTPKDVVVLGSTRYDVLWVRDAGGAGHHLEADARRFTT